MLAGANTAQSLQACDLVACAFFDLLAAGDLIALERWYRAVLQPSLGLEWKALRQKGILPVIGALATVIAGTVRNGSKHKPAEVGAVINNACNMGLADQRHIWAPIVAATLNSPHAKLARSMIGPATPAIINAAIRAGDPAELRSRMSEYAPLMKRIFPGLLQTFRVP